IEEHVERVEADRSDAEAHGELGLVYEANSLWHEAQACFANAAALADDDFLWRYHEAIGMRQTGAVEAALVRMEELAGDRPDFAPLQHRIGLALLEAGRVDDAESRFRRAADLAPGAPEPMVGLADVHVRRQRYEDAAALLERVLAVDDSYRTAHYLLGLAYRGLGRRQDAAAAMGRGVNAVPRFMPDPLTARTGEHTVNLAHLLGQAARYIEAGHPGEAAVILERAIVDRPDDINIMNNLASAYMDLGRLGEAHAMLSRAFEIDPGAFPTSINLSACSLAMRRVEEANRHADRAVDLAPTIGQAWYTRARARTAVKRYEEALADLEQAVRLNIHRPDAYLALGELCFVLQRIPEALEHYETATRLLPNSLPAHVSVGGLRLRLNDIEGARAALAEAERLDARHPRVVSLRERIERAAAGGAAP
ncbi:MAG: tetratricopeptide repeat protein, partial [Planctomycetota bacterium]